MKKEYNGVKKYYMVKYGSIKGSKLFSNYMNKHNPIKHNPIKHNPNKHNPNKHNPIKHNPIKHNPIKHNPNKPQRDKQKIIKYVEQIENTNDKSFVNIDIDNIEGNSRNDVEIHDIGEKRSLVPTTHTQMIIKKYNTKMYVK
jgi:hypothetical protein